MKNILVALLFLFSSLSAASPKEEAIQFITEFGVGNNLKALAAKTAMGTQTFRIILAEVGKDDAKHFVVPALEESVSKYQDAWNATLATAYLEYFTEEQLKSVRETKQKSPYFKAIGEKQELIGRYMEENAKPLLVKIVAEAMKNAYLEAIGSNNAGHGDR